MAGVLLVAGLGNPGGRYDDTRHNAGFWFVDAVAGYFGESFAAKKTFGAQMAKVPKAADMADMAKAGNDNANSGTDGADGANSGADGTDGTNPGIIRLLKPDAYMNESGAAVAAAARYFGIVPRRILVAHDEADLPPGIAKLKCGGGEAGHRGLQDVSRALGGCDYWRLRLGVGKGEGGAGEHVLRRPPKAERELIDDAINRAVNLWQEITGGQKARERAMMTLHSGAK